MDFDHYTDPGVGVAVNLVNSLGSAWGYENLRTADDVRGLLDAQGLEGYGPVEESDLEPLRALRPELRAIFEAPDEHAAAARINALLARSGAAPQMTDHDGKWHLHYAADDAPLADRVAAVAAMGLATVVVRWGWERLGVCRADDCADVFVDTSRNKSRRYCDPSCSTRMNVAAFRARHKERAYDGGGPGAD
ncbi:MAG: CGNR zinc finger domain-containing protein [Actinomycetota bacterium]|nr:CGNR zinc finger domain-containing protein [Actinomycetota bacterium]